MNTIQRIDPPLHADEMTMLRAYLDYHRDTFRQKTADLDAAQLDTRLPPSEMTLGGMIKHLALVEDNWFSVVFAGNDDAPVWQGVDWEADDDWDWHSASDDTPAQLRQLLEDAVAASDAILAAADGPDAGSALTSRETGQPKFSLRWILVHMIEEYARHNGHADLIRESIDGLTGE
ncbi:DinB family protein [Nocardioides sp. AE5]|uniref:DinB family protein n=1 Tax=Nocardioides sp. AE5 TaxID=2962573 RepID=UPI0028829A8F|nr:DinB family protein [Nocardioides sp. AE5]MDT0202270.1 DinB family protein [Nocardioides sp. AE5]